LKSQGLAHKDIAKLTGVCSNTLHTYLQYYQIGGINKFKEIHFYQAKSELKQHQKSLEEYFKTNPVASINEASAKIEELMGIKRSLTKVREFLYSLGIKRRKIGMIPSKADDEVQENYKNEKLEPRLLEAKQGKRLVVDAAHFVLEAYRRFLWSFTRLSIKAPAGRKRFNVLGKRYAITHELITGIQDSYINALRYCDLLWEI
jgi:transposase